MSLTDALAGYGAVIATALLGWDAYKYLHERARIRVSCAIARVYSLDSAGLKPGQRAEPESPPLLTFRVTNTGPKTVYITQVGGGLANGLELLINPKGVSLPKRLDPGEYFHVQTDPKAVTKDLRFLAAWDSLDNVWKVDRRGLKRLQQEVAKLPA